MPINFRWTVSITINPYEHRHYHYHHEPFGESQLLHDWQARILYVGIYSAFKRSGTLCCTMTSRQRRPRWWAVIRSKLMQWPFPRPWWSKPSRMRSFIGSSVRQYGSSTTEASSRILAGFKNAVSYRSGWREDSIRSAGWICVIGRLDEQEMIPPEDLLFVPHEPLRHSHVSFVGFPPSQSIHRHNPDRKPQRKILLVLDSNWRSSWTACIWK